MSGATPPLSQYASMAWCLVKHRDNFTFTFTESREGNINLNLTEIRCKSSDWIHPSQNSVRWLVFVNTGNILIS
jgi:hypothetical protein